MVQLVGSKSVEWGGRYGFREARLRERLRPVPCQEWESDGPTLLMVVGVGMGIQGLTMLVAGQSLLEVG